VAWEECTGVSADEDDAGGGRVEFERNSSQELSIPEEDDADLDGCFP